MAATDYMKAFTDAMDQRGYNYDAEVRGDGNGHVTLGFKGDNFASVKYHFIFDDEGKVTIWGVVCPVPADKLANVILVCNTLNCKYRWFKFYVDDDNDTMIQGDAIIDLATGGAECAELLSRAVNITDEVYPDIQRAIWA